MGVVGGDGGGGGGAAAAAAGGGGGGKHPEIEGEPFDSPCGATKNRPERGNEKVKRSALGNSGLLSGSIFGASDPQNGFWFPLNDNKQGGPTRE